MGYYRTCPYCGLNLDPGERCDCEAVERDNLISTIEGLYSDLTQTEAAELLKPYAQKYGWKMGVL